MSKEAQEWEEDTSVKLSYRLKAKVEENLTKNIWKSSETTSKKGLSKIEIWTDL